MNYFYHGSTIQNLKVLEPRHRYVPVDEITYEAIYATIVPAFAAAHSFPWSSGEGFILNTTDRKIKMTVPVKFRDRLSVPVSIYKISVEGFEKTLEESTGLTWHTKNPVVVIEEVKYPSAENAIQTLGGEIFYK
jgi:hypothetical protein